MTDITTILWISVIMQCVAVVLALLLIPVTGRALAWIILSIAFSLMATRRALSLIFEKSVIKDTWLHAFTTEIVALIISFMIVAGVFMIRKIFIQQREDADKVRTLSLAVEQNPGVTIIVDTSGKINYVNSAYCDLTGKSLDNVIGQLPEVLNPDFMDKKILESIWSSMRSGKTWEGELQNPIDIDRAHWDKTTISPVKDNRKQITHYVILQEDISEQKEHREQLEYLAMHDALTGLPNRTLFNDRLEQAIIAASRENEPLAVMLMDLNNFKNINDTMGHQVGDGILKEIGTRLLKIIRGADTVARMGGDEFLILLPASDPDKRAQFIKRITSILESPFFVGDRSFEISASIGLAMYPDDGDNPELLLRHADIAMYSAKATSSTYMRYDESLDAGNSGRLQLSNSLRRAIETDQFLIHYQPLISFATDTVQGVEALIRWNHPERGLLFPDSFIPLAEQTNHITGITQWVIINAFRDVARWTSMGYELGISINISARDLLAPEFYNSIKQGLASNGISPSNVTIEITESALMTHTHQTMNNLNKLRETGVNIAIDDFGTGYSSLQHLKRFPVSILKIDKSFVMNMTNDDNDAIIVRSTTDLAHNMGLKVTAEGIEQQDCYELVNILGCDYGQGYLISTPMTFDNLIAWLDNYPKKVRA